MYGTPGVWKPSQRGKSGGSPFQKMLRSKKTSSLDASIIVQTVAGTLPVGSTLERWGYETDGLCVEGRCKDDIANRLGGCTRVGQDEAPSPEVDIAGEEVLPHWRKGCLVPFKPCKTSGQSEGRPEPLRVMKRWRSADSASRRASLLKEMALLKLQHGSSCQAGWAAVQWDPDRSILRGVWGPVHRHNPQLAPAAEHEALVHAAQHGAEEYITDCQAIIDEWSSGWTGATSCSRVLCRVLETASSQGSNQYYCQGTSTCRGPHRPQHGRGHGHFPQRQG